MSAISRGLSRLEDSLRAALPGRVISTEFVDFAQRRSDELRQGIVTLLLPGGDLDTWETSLRLTLVGQIAVPERTATQRALRDAEQWLLAELLAWIRNPGNTVPLLASSFKTSSQMEFPHGWVSIDLVSGPLDLADASDDELYPPNRQPGQLQHWQMGIDLPPVAAPDEQAAWVAELAATPPDLSTLVELSHANRPTETG